MTEITLQPHPPVLRTCAIYLPTYLRRIPHLASSALGLPPIEPSAHHRVPHLGDSPFYIWGSRSRFGTVGCNYMCYGRLESGGSIGGYMSGAQGRLGSMSETE